nr:death domain-associated protein 6-like [Penaeus vannamei]
MRSPKYPNPRRMRSPKYPNPRRMRSPKIRKEDEESEEAEALEDEESEVSESQEDEESEEAEALEDEESEEAEALEDEESEVSESLEDEESEDPNPWRMRIQDPNPRRMRSPSIRIPGDEESQRGRSPGGRSPKLAHSVADQRDQKAACRALRPVPRGARRRRRRPGEEEGSRTPGRTGRPTKVTGRTAKGQPGAREATGDVLPIQSRLKLE